MYYVADMSHRSEDDYHVIISALTMLYEDTHREMMANPESAMKLATDPLGPLPEKMDGPQAAAMTVVGNVLLNLDEMFLKR